MLSKLFTRLNQTQSMTQLAQKAFRASPQMNKKPSIGDAVTILQSKVSNINQVVSRIFLCPFHIRLIRRYSSSSRGL